MKQPSYSRRIFLRDAAIAAAGLAAAPALLRAHGLQSPDSIAAIASAHGILAGCAVSGPGLANDPDFAKLVAAQAGIVVSENDMKWQALRPGPTTFDYAAADRLVDFARRNRILVRGHNLCWHEALPHWFASTVNKDNATQFLIDHIRNVAGHFAGQLQSWDVVNEAVQIGDGLPGGLRNSPWMRLLGPGYIDTAFRAARAADPHARLVYNDYDVEQETHEQDQRRDAVLQLVKGMQQRGTPIDAVGIQSHISATVVCSDSLRHFIRDLHKLGLEVYVTEMDFGDSELHGNQAARDHAVAEAYGRYLDLVLSEGVRTVLTWGITDRYTWLNTQYGANPRGARPLPFDQNLQPVEAFHAITAAFARLPASR